MASPQVEVRETKSRPTVTFLSREGDPRSAVALAVMTEGGSVAAAALAGVVASRLDQRGLAHVTTQADRDGYRVEALVSGPGEATALLEALREALLTPLSAGSEEIAEANQRMVALKGARAELRNGAAADCTGRLGLLEDEPLIDWASTEGLARLESLRRASHLASRTSIGVVGPRTVGDAAADAIAKSKAWPDGSPPKASWPERDATEVVSARTSAKERLRATIALRVGDARQAILAAERAGDPEGALAHGLSALPSAFRIVEVVATARPRGGCLAATIEPKQPLGGASTLEALAKAAASTRSELEADLAEAFYGPARDPFRAAIDESDPRQAASLAAWWSLALRGASADAPVRALVVAELPASPASTARADRDRAARREHFANLLAEAGRAREERVVESLVRVERGQSRLWLLLASPCALTTEGSSEAGLTALSILSALTTEAGSRDGVSLEPWLSAEGVGILAHASRRSDESSHALATRVAREAARALVGSVRAPSGFFAARSTLLARLADESGRHGVALEAASLALAPSHPSWISPLGSWDAVTRLGPEAAALRSQALLAGPLRVAVIADLSASQGEVAARTLDRWLSRETKRPRACPSPGARPEPKPGLVQIELDSAASARAILAFPAPAKAAPDRESAALMVAGLEGANGWLAEALGSFPSLGSLPSVTATARLAGGDFASALLVDLRAPDELLDSAVAELRGLFQRLAAGSTTTEDFERAVRLRADSELRSSLDPRRRAVDLWLGREATAPRPTFEAFRAFAKEALSEEKAVLVIARPSKL